MLSTVVLGACSSGQVAGGPAEDPSAPTTTTMPCPAVDPETPGVVRAPCGEGGFVSVQVDPQGDGSFSQERRFPGAVCNTVEEAVEVVAGVEVTGAYEGFPPDHIELLLPAPPVELEGFPTFGRLTIDGIGMLLTDASGTIEELAGAFAATVEESMIDVRVSYSCGLGETATK